MIQKDLSDVILEWLHVLLSWPPLTFLFLFWFVHAFNSEIRAAIKRLKKVGKEGAEFSSQEELGKDFEERVREKEKSEEDYEEKLKREVESKRKALDLAERILNDLKSANKYLRYERTYRVIFGTQMHLLEMLRGNRPGVRSGSLKKIFYEGGYLKLGGESDYTFDGYMGFLKTFRLVEFDSLQENDVVKITGEGIGFLDYVERFGYTKSKVL